MRIYAPTAVFLALAAAAPAQKVAILEIGVENSVTYLFDVADPAQRAVKPDPTPPTVNKAFVDSCQIDDIVAVNGKPAKGLHMTCMTRMGFSPSAQTGSGIADVSQVGANWECAWEIYSAEGNFVGRFVDGGFFPHSIKGGAGAYFGATGEHQSVSGVAARLASVAEDPARRRINGGGKYKVIYYVAPKVWPEVASTPAGPSILHASDFSQVSTAKPAKAGEMLIMVAKGLGPTLPGLIPQGAKVFASEAPLDEVNSPVEVTVNGEAAAVTNKVGWPGTKDTYRVDFQVPPGTAAGMARVQMTAAWIPADEVAIPVQ